MTNTAHFKAWMTVAEAYATPRDKRTEQQNYIAYRGLCCAANRSGFPFCGIACCNNTAFKHKTGYWWPDSPKQDQYRALSAMLIAHMGEEEFRLLREKK